MTETTLPGGAGGADTEPVEHTAPEHHPAASTSALTGLRQRRAAAGALRHIDLTHPRWPGVGVRYRPVGFGETKRANARHAKSKADDKDVIVNAVVLAGACLGVYLFDPDAEPGPDGQVAKWSADDEHPDEDWPRFDQRLADILGIDLSTSTTPAVDVVRAVYELDGDLMSTAGLLAQRSGFVNSELLEDERGN